MSALAGLSAGVTRAYDAVRRTFWGAEAKLVLLKKDGRATPYRVVATLVGSWGSGEPRGAYLDFIVADIGVDAGKSVRAAGHLMVTDSDVAGMNNVVMEFRANGTTPPTGTQPWWTIRTRNTSTLYIPPDAEV